MGDRELSGLRNASIGFVSQSFHLLPRLRVRENVSLPLAYHGAPGAAPARCSRRWAWPTAPTTVTASSPGVSCQRVAIARALVGEPDILLADEPTGALDPNTGAEITRLIVGLNQTERLTAVIITHDRSVVRQCARCAHISDGVLSEAAHGRPAVRTRDGPAAG